MFLCPHPQQIEYISDYVFPLTEEIFHEPLAIKYYMITLCGLRNKQNYVFQTIGYILLFSVYFYNSDKCDILNFLLCIQVLHQFSQITKTTPIFDEYPRFYHVPSINCDRNMGYNIPIFITFNIFRFFL